MRISYWLAYFFMCPGLAAQTAVSIVRDLPAYQSDIVYAGLDNLLRVEAAGVPPTHLQLLPAFGNIRPDSIPGHFIWTICHLDSSRATLVLRDRKRGQVLDTLIFKVKMIPPPKFVLLPRGTCLPGGEPDLDSPVGIAAVLENFQFEVRCNMVHFTAFIYPKGEDILQKTNAGARFQDVLNGYVMKVKPGDKFTFRDFRYQCGCDATVRRSLEVLNLEIK